MASFVFYFSFFILFGRAASPHKKSSYFVGAFFVGLRRAIRSITFALAPSARAAARAAPTRFGGSASIPLAQGASSTVITSLLFIASAILLMRITGSDLYFILPFFYRFCPRKSNFIVVETGHALSLHWVKSVTKINFMCPA
jgi:hypothetical protein